jgi:pSer/pThr/pTyr-binding forkhead associated (FHA) protein
VALKLPTIIGRGHEAGVTVAHPMVSRRHCEVFEADGLLMVRDLGSRNGTLVRGQRIKEAPLPPDAKFTVGPLTFSAQYEYAGDLSDLPEPVLVEPADKPAAAEATPAKPAAEKAPAKKPAAAPVAKNKPVEKAVSVAKPKTQPAKPAEKTVPVAKPKAEPPKKAASPDDVFDNILEELT